MAKARIDSQSERLLAHLRAIVDSSDDAILSKDLEGIVVSCNKAAENLYGYSADELVGKPISILVPEDRADEVPGFLTKIERGERIEHHETVRVDKWGKHVVVSLTISPIKEPDGTVVGASTIAREISVLSRAEEELINDILHVLKNESGNMELEELDFDVRDAVEETAELRAERAQAKGLELATFVEPGVPAGVHGDPRRLRQVLVNLVDNSVRYTEKGEVVVWVSVANEGHDWAHLRFEVRDTGIGIRPDREKRLFQSFSQADASSTGLYGGTSLGLLISRRLVELVGGDIGVESEKGKGSRFWFTVRVGKSPKAFPSPTPSPTLTDLPVLVVDDNPTIRKIFEQTLLAWGMRPAPAESGEEAVTMLRAAASRRKPYAVALLDYSMPVMDGMTLAREIKNDPTIEGVRLVLATSSGHLAEVRAAADDSIDAYLTKPMKTSHLHDRLVRVMEPGRPGSQDVVSDQAPPDADRNLEALVLVVDDNPVNQRVAVHMLELMGYRTEVAANGREAVEAVGRVPYAAVLMDCQMPEMDGYEATREIRRMAGAPSKTPIIAMTAEAMRGDEDRARDAGMDDYVAKPVIYEQLGAALRRSMRGTVTAGARSDSESLSGEEAQHPLDRETLGSLQRLEDQRKGGAGDLIAEFLDATAKSLGDLRRFIAGRDAQGAAFAAHSLRGSVGTLGARRMADMCARIEKLAADNKVADATEALAQIEREFDRVCLALGAGPLHSPSDRRNP